MTEVILRITSHYTYLVSYGAKTDQITQVWTQPYRSMLAPGIKNCAMAQDSTIEWKSAVLSHRRQLIPHRFLQKLFCYTLRQVVTPWQSGKVVSSKFVLKSLINSLIRQNNYPEKNWSCCISCHPFEPFPSEIVLFLWKMHAGLFSHLKKRQTWGLVHNG